MYTRHVNVKAGYDVKIGQGLLENIGTEIEKLNLNINKVAVITDSNVKDLYLETCLKSLNKFGDASAIIFNAGEESKNIETFGEILEALAMYEITRNDLIIALGGGVAGDIAGFAAGCYMRGIKFIQVPTTLLAAVDSSVGGKTAIDLQAGKNLAGLFYQPELVLCDIDLLKTLPEIEMQCGMAEALKTGILRGDDLFRYFEDEFEAEDDNNEQDFLAKIINLCVDYKAGIVERDEREQGERKLLNLGHTIGHAIELLSDYKIKHGLAVAQGIKVMNQISFNLAWSDEETFTRINNALSKNKFDLQVEFDADSLIEAILSDKKRKGDEITIIVPVKIGACELFDININTFGAMLEMALDFLSDDEY